MNDWAPVAIALVALIIRLLRIYDYANWSNISWAFINVNYASLLRILPHMFFVIYQPDPTKGWHTLLTPVCTQLHQNFFNGNGVELIVAASLW